MRRTRTEIGILQVWSLHLVAVALSFAVLAVGPSAVAQETPSQPAPAKARANKVKTAAPASGPSQDQAQGPTKDPAASLASYSSGVKAYQSGKYDAAVAALTTAINGGGLAANLMPKALYYRGASYEKQGQSGLAISDLNSALWFKPGLDDSERASANAARAGAYAIAGMPNPGPASRQNETAASAEKVGETGSLPEAQKPAAGLGGFFGSMFGGAAAPIADKVAGPTATPPTLVAQTRASPTSANISANETEVLPWTTKSAAVGSGELPAKSASTKATSGKPAVAKKIAGFRIQVAAVKSRDEASAVVSKLQSLGGSVAATQATVDETKFGTMGTFFRVRLGPFASAAATKEPCAQLKAGGLDCLVTAK